MPTILQKYPVNWCHMYPLHPEMDCTDDTISQHYFWTNLRDNIRKQIKVGINDQRNKKKRFKIWLFTC